MAQGNARWEERSPFTVPHENEEDKKLATLYQHITPTLSQVLSPELPIQTI